jgi:hypothetical protein
VDAIVALTGGYQRIDQALGIAGERCRRTSADFGRQSIHHGAALRRATGTKSATFACCVDIGYQALDTIGNANETASGSGSAATAVFWWSPTITTCHAAFWSLSQASPDVTFLAYPVTHADLKTETWLADPVALRTLFTEYAKYSLARLRYWSGAKTSSGLRADVYGQAASDLQPASDFSRRTGFPPLINGVTRITGSARVSGSSPTPTRNPAMIALRSVLFNIAFYINLIVRMILFIALLLHGRTQEGLVRTEELGSRSNHWLQAKIVGTTFEIEGLENIPDTGYIFAPKHQSFWDAYALLPWLDDPVYILKRELMAGSRCSASMSRR